MLPKAVPLVFFLLGFAFDAFVLGRIDDLFTMLQQGAYLVVSGALLGFDFLAQAGRFDPGQGRFAKVWKYREALIHFLLGTLMNAYTIFYFKSSSVVTSFVYVGVLILILTVTEFRKFGGSQIIVQMALWNLCLVSYSLYLVPILVGFIGLVPFALSIMLSSGLSLLFYLRIRKLVGATTPALTKRILAPLVGVHLLFIALYAVQAIPPVPLSASFMGIYHDVKNENGRFVLTYTDTSWNLFSNGDQTFHARPGDRVFCFARIFSPARFSDQLIVRWLYKDAKQRWMTADAIPFAITGGREEGFRGYTVKNHYSPGEWRCQIETSDGREISRTTFRIVEDLSTEERATTSDIH